jgi:hypothetical protein
MQFVAILILAALWAKWGWVLIAICVGTWLIYRLVREIRTSNAERAT